MDPNTALEEARGLVFAILNGHVAEGAEAMTAEDLARQFDALDEWLSKGGFLPGPWRR